MDIESQALNSGQIPANLKILDDSGSSRKETDDKMVTDSHNDANVEPNNSEEQEDNEPAPMEQVSFYLFCGFKTKFSIFLCSLLFLYSFMLEPFFLMFA